MTYDTRTTWSCDRCEEVSIEFATHQPEGWARLMLVFPPKAVPDSDSVQLAMDLCPTCIVVVRSSVDKSSAVFRGQEQ